MLSAVRVALRYLLALTMITAGVLHFVAESSFTRIVPPYLPAARLLVWISGVAEIVLGVGLIPARTRRWSGYGLVALYIAVFPANLYMAMNHVELEGLPSSPLALWVRLPFQLVLIGWALWTSAPAVSDGARARER
jgi:uncharacterized membrane protein